MEPRWHRWARAQREAGSRTDARIADQREPVSVGHGGDGVFVVPMGSLDGDPGIAPRADIFVESKAPWFTISGDLPQFPEAPDPALRSGSR